MHMRRIVSILILVLFISCKWNKAEAEGKDAYGVIQDTPEVVAEKATEEVSKATGKSVAEVKALSKDELDRFAADAVTSAEAAIKSAEAHNNHKDNASIIDEIKRAAGKFALAFKALVGAGFRDAMIPVIGNIKTASLRFELVGKLARMLESGSGTIGEVGRNVVEFGVADYCISVTKDNQHAGTKVAEGELKECVTNLMGSIVTLFDKGVQRQLEPFMKGAPEKFKDALFKLWNANFTIQRALLKIM
ncbi:hypothetical protein [Borrelia sp. P9F1]|uniref:hypothetical protein n=1 Tax=Borrelia sp. P9F1 TaxID=3058374 RepID=UPI002648FD45|nr:hypothetical protein [Borrelia sp. P9F1]WKC58501.1 hypothetical protein QYZ68_04800 [Borrelia sp. P9F1]